MIFGAVLKIHLYKYFININTMNNKKYDCDHCLKIYSSKYNLKKHRLLCSVKKVDDANKERDFLIEERDNANKERDDANKELEKKDKEILKLKNYIIKLETENKIYTKDNELIKELAKKPQQINNKIMNISSLNLDEKHVRNLIDTLFDHNYAIEGQKGVAKFAMDNLLKDSDDNINYICTDPSRQTFKYKDEKTGELKRDIKAKKLTKTLLKCGIKHKNNSATKNWYTKDDGKIDDTKFNLIYKKAFEINNLDEDNKIFCQELSSRTSM